LRPGTGEGFWLGGWGQVSMLATHSLPEARVSAPPACLRALQGQEHFPPTGCRKASPPRTRPNAEASPPAHARRPNQDVARALDYPGIAIVQITQVVWDGRAAPP